MLRSVSRFSKRIETVISEQNSEAYASYITKDVSEWFYDIVTSDDYPYDFEIKYTISGRITYNANTGQISNCSAAKLDFEAFVGTMWSIAIDSISTSSKIASDKYSAFFSANFHITGTLVIPIGDFLIGYICDYGWQTNSVTGYVE